MLIQCKLNRNSSVEYDYATMCFRQQHRDVNSAFKILFSRFFFHQWIKNSIYFDTRGENGRLAYCKCENAAVSESPAWPHVPNHIFFTNSCEPELAHRLQTSRMRRNSTSLNSCQHDDINIVTVSVARRR